MYRCQQCHGGWKEVFQAAGPQKEKPRSPNLVDSSKQSAVSDAFGFSESGKYKLLTESGIHHEIVKMFPSMAFDISKSGK